jgi:hypothetical protein
MKRLVINNSFHIIHLVSLSYIKTSSQQPPNNFFLSNFLSTQEVEKSPSLSLYSINIVETKDGARGKRSSVHLLKNIDNSDPGFNACYHNIIKTTRKFTYMEKAMDFHKSGYTTCFIIK